MPLQIRRACAERHLSVPSRIERRAYFAGIGVDGYRNALRYGDYANAGFYDFGGMREGNVPLILEPNAFTLQSGTFTCKMPLIIFNSEPEIGICKGTYI
jgi:hypothetical protein